MVAVKKPRRKYKEELRISDNLLNQTRIRAEHAERRLAEAKNMALQEFMINSNLMENAIGYVSDCLGREMSKELAPYAQKLFKAAGKERNVSPMSFDIYSDAKDYRVEILRVEVAPISYNVKLNMF